MGIFAGLGVAQATLTLALGIAMSFYSYYASKRLHRASSAVRSAAQELTTIVSRADQAISRLFFAPMAFFDTVPIGRCAFRISHSRAC